MARAGHDLSREAGQIIIGGFDGDRVPPDFEDAIARGIVGGAILFSRNLRSIEQTAALVQHLSGLPAPAPLWLAVDQEGGRVQRLRAPFPELPPMRRVGELGREALAADVGTLLGSCLGLLGFHQDYAPVLDVDTNPANPVIGDRSFARDPEAVGRFGAALIGAMQATGVAACGKHFPGHGDTSQDSHLELPRLDHDLARLQAVELVPFRRAVEVGVAALMTAHVLFPALDADHPATLSDRIIRPILRDQLGYDGVVVSDDLEMKAITHHYGIGDAAVRAVRAGCDQLLVCHTLALQVEAHEALIHAVERGLLPAERLAEAARRVAVMKGRYAVPRWRPAPREVVAHFPADLAARVTAALGTALPGVSV